MTGLTQKRMVNLRDQLKQINAQIKKFSDIPESLLVSRDYHREAIKKLCKKS